MPLFRLVYVIFFLPGIGLPELPEGSAGLASRYPGDEGIETDSSVLFVERFDQTGVESLAKRWDTVTGQDRISFSKDTAPGTADGQAILITHTGGQGTGAGFYRRLLPGHDRVFARWYVKFDPDCFPVHHFGTHLGGFNPPTRWPQGGAGTRPDGNKRFTSGVEPFGKSWAWDFYTYWQGMHRHGDGNYWGTPFLVNGEKPEVKKGRWICVEMMMQMNDPGKANGEQAFWIDGKLWRREGQIASHIGPGFPKGKWRGGWWEPNSKSDSTFEGFRWRNSDEIKINYLWTYLYITKAPAGHVSRVWFDNIVVATEYIGPVKSPEK